MSDLQDTPLTFLQTRRSAKVRSLAAPGPGPREMETILRIASRVPDHKKLSPWRFVVFDGEARARFGEEVLAPAYKAANPDASPAKLELETETLTRAPVVVAVISSVTSYKAPRWEQELSCGAACFALCLGANALGFGTNWLSEWYSFDANVAAALDVKEGERIAGFIYIGTDTNPQDERERPALADIVTYR